MWRLEPRLKAPASRRCVGYGTRFSAGHVFGLKDGARKLRRMKMFNACAVGMLAARLASADPIHAVGDGSYWHHDSGWIFPARIAGFERVGFPQDVAGTRDAVAYYAREMDGVRVVISVDVFPVDSAAEATTLDSAKAVLEKNAGVAATGLEQSTLALGAGDLRATHVFLREPGRASFFTFYWVESGDWRVRIWTRSPQASPATTPAVEAFVRGQRWDTLPRQ